MFHFINKSVKSWTLWHAKGTFDIKAASFFKTLENGTCHAVKGWQAVHINHDIPKEVKSGGARPFLSEMTNTGRFSMVGLI